MAVSSKRKAREAKLARELQEARAHQAATAGILKAISRSPADLGPTFRAILESTTRLCESNIAALFLYDGQFLTCAAHHGTTARFAKALQKLRTPPSKDTATRLCALTRKVLHVHDYHNDRRFKLASASLRENSRSLLAVPLLRGRSLVGVVTTWRREVRPFSGKHVALLQSFAAQAVIAIENARLFRDLRSSDERYDIAMRAINEGVYDWDIANDKVFYSDRVYTAVGLSREDYSTAKDWRDRIHPEDRPKYDAALVAHFKRKTRRFECDYRYRTNDGEWHWARQHGIAVRDANGRAVRLIGSTGNIDELKNAELDLHRAHDETREALERQTATAEILKVIASSPSDVQPVFDAIVHSAKRLIGGLSASMRRLAGDTLHLAAFTPLGRAGDKVLKSGYPRPLSKEGTHERVVRSRAPLYISDTEKVPTGLARTKEMGRTRGYRSLVIVPMLHNDKVIGTISVTRRAPGAFSKHQIELLKTFADQAVIAIENVRLFNETREALEQQKASGEVLGAISGSIADTAPVFDKILESCGRLFAGRIVGLNLVREDGMLHIGAYHGAYREEFERNFPIPLTRDSGSGLAIEERRVVHYPDAQHGKEVPERTRQGCEAIGIKSVIFAPMLWKDRGVGTIFVGRDHVSTFSEKEISLLRTFADQAAIAIENVRLFNETKEALERQTATAEILEVIASSPSDVQPVFDAIARSAYRLIGGFSTAVARVFDDVLRLVAFSSTGEAGNEALKHAFPMPVSRSKAARTGTPVAISDTEALPDSAASMRELARTRGFRSIVIVPMLREGAATGTISVTRREPGEFTDHQVNLLKTFADQAVIAIENVRLFNETKESLERQTATAEILKVISSSPNDLRPVFDTILENATRLCDAHLGTLGLFDGERYQQMAQRGASGEFAAWLFRPPFVPDPRTSIGRMVAECKAIHHADIRESQGYREGVEGTMRMADLSGGRSYLAVPMPKDGRVVGGIVIYRREVRPFTHKQIDLLSTFANQAVIAIENVRLFKELETRTEALTKSVGQLTALGDVGRAISSTLDLETVLKTIVARAVQLTGLNGGTIYEFDERGGEFHLRAAENMSEELAEVYRKMPIRLGEGVVGGAGAKREPVQVADIQAPGYQTRYREELIRQGYRAILAVPLLREEQIIGALTVNRNEPGAFAPEVVELLKTFATQSAMAIQNARLFREIAEKGKQLEEASQHKSQFLASMSHELRTPLNAILGFNEMVLDEVYGEIAPDLKAPLENMQASGRHLLRLINNVLDLAKIEAGRMELALADYAVQDAVQSVHRTLQPLAAEKGLEFLARVPDDVPLAHGDGGRITQCLMNLAGNSLKFTKAGRVEISVVQRDGLLRYSVADTGIGIPPDKIASLFTEFKQTDATIASEYGGTGLGLSISKKFIEMHGGRIWVESEVGRGSTFIFEVPIRVNA